MNNGDPWPGTYSEWLYRWTLGPAALDPRPQVDPRPPSDTPLTSDSVTKPPQHTHLHSPTHPNTQTPTPTPHPPHSPHYHHTHTNYSRKLTPQSQSHQRTMNKNFPHLCSQVHNAFMARARRTAVPDTILNRSVCNILYSEGFVSSITSGDDSGPYDAGIQVPVTPDNVARRKLWLHLKYRYGNPVLSQLKIISKPSRRVFASLDELKSVVSGARDSPLLKRSRMGQITILDTPFGIIEAREALKRGVAGEVLCIAY